MEKKDLQQCGPDIRLPEWEGFRGDMREYAVASMEKELLACVQRI